jgi:hypothetical protein
VLRLLSIYATRSFIETRHRRSTQGGRLKHGAGLDDVLLKRFDFAFVLLARSHSFSTDCRVQEQCDACQKLLNLRQT